MATPNALEQQLLTETSDRLDEVVGDPGPREHARRLEVLEALSARLGGFALDGLRETDDEQRDLSTSEALCAADAVMPVLQEVPIHPSLALASLAREPVDGSACRRLGVYYTDFRLAQWLARETIRRPRREEMVLDAASGTGILLVAAALAAGEGKPAAEFVASSAHAADLSATALRGVKLSLASLTSDNGAIALLAQRLLVIDSLVAGPDAWQEHAPEGFDLVIGNPPWEKLKVTRHEHLAAQGINRHYGAEYEGLDLSALEDARSKMVDYARRAGEDYALHGGGEVDLYKLFLALALDLASAGGQIAYLVPAGLIRSQGTEALRRHLLTHAAELEISVSDNRARYFPIDTRFKFLGVHAVLDGTSRRRSAVALNHLAGDELGVRRDSGARIGRRTLRRLRPDLTVPEVKSSVEWRLYRKMAASSQTCTPWDLEIVRELDMTRDRHMFSRDASSPGVVPLVEGRMIHQFRRSAKRYVSGTGRGARWELADTGEADLGPQFYVDPVAMPVPIQRRIKRHRIGFCDITGQTNERTMLAARIPSGVACGNKVPTVTFSAEDGFGDRSWLWLSIVNSFCFDWLLRRVVTTTVNFFLLRSVPLPGIDPSDPLAQKIVALGREVDREYHGQSGTGRTIGQLRAEIDACVCLAYGLDEADVELLFCDFPLIDRGQLPLPGEACSTITRDTVQKAFLEATGAPRDLKINRRVADASLLEATPFVPAEAAKRTRRASVASA